MALVRITGADVNATTVSVTGTVDGRAASVTIPRADLDPLPRAGKITLAAQRLRDQADLEAQRFSDLIASVVV